MFLHIYIHLMFRQRHTVSFTLSFVFLLPVHVPFLYVFLQFLMSHYTVYQEVCRGLFTALLVCLQPLVKPFGYEHQLQTVF